MKEHKLFFELLSHNKIEEINSYNWSKDLTRLQFDSFDRCFDNNIDGLKFPDSIKHIYFSYSFDQSLDNVKLPLNLETLVFGKRFNKSIKNIIFPNNIKILQFGSRFNQSIDDIIFPESLEHIYFEDEFNHSLSNIKISNNTCIHLNSVESAEKLPSNLEHFSITCLTKPLLNLPITLKTFKFYYNLENSFEQTKIPFGCKVFKINEYNRQEEIII